jgi:hypothetical protein
VGAVAVVLFKPTRRRVCLARLDADLDGPVSLASARRPIAARLVGILGPIGLATFLAARYACASSGDTIPISSSACAELSVVSRNLSPRGTERG